MVFLFVSSLVLLKIFCLSDFFNLPNQMMKVAATFISKVLLLSLGQRCWWKMLPLQWRPGPPWHRIAVTVIVTVPGSRASFVIRMVWPIRSLVVFNWTLGMKLRSNSIKLSLDLYSRKSAGQVSTAWVEPLWQRNPGLLFSSQTQGLFMKQKPRRPGVGNPPLQVFFLAFSKQTFHHLPGFFLYSFFCRQQNYPNLLHWLSTL